MRWELRNLPPVEPNRAVSALAATPPHLTAGLIAPATEDGVVTASNCRASVDAGQRSTHLIRREKGLARANVGVRRDMIQLAWQSL